MTLRFRRIPQVRQHLRPLGHQSLQVVARDDGEVAVPSGPKHGQGDVRHQASDPCARALETGKPINPQQVVVEPAQVPLHHSLHRLEHQGLQVDRRWGRGHPGEAPCHRRGGPLQGRHHVLLRDDGPRVPHVRDRPGLCHLPEGVPCPVRDGAIPAPDGAREPGRPHRVVPEGPRWPLHGQAQSQGP